MCAVVVEEALADCLLVLNSDCVAGEESALMSLKEVFFFIIIISVSSAS